MMRPNLSVNRTRRLMSFTWRASARRAGYLQRKTSSQLCEYLVVFLAE
jgi:hypothetical protein